MPEIHPSAIVDANVQLADDVIVGPMCVLEGRITIGPGTKLLHRVSLQGPLVIGQRNTLYPNVCLGYAPQDLKYDPAEGGPGVVIGDGNVFREGMTIHRATSEKPTSVGDENYFMANTHLGHDVVIGRHCMLANGALVAGHVEIGDNVIMGGNAVVHQFCRIGRLSMIAGTKGTTQDIPPFCTLYNSRTIGSLNIIGLRRAGYRQSIPPLKQAFEIVFMQGLPRPVAVKHIHDECGGDPLVREFAEFISTSKRGVAPYGGGRRTFGDASESAEEIIT